MGDETQMGDVARLSGVGVDFRRYFWTKRSAGESTRVCGRRPGSWRHFGDGVARRVAQVHSGSDDTDLFSWDLDRHRFGAMVQRDLDAE